jgi:hypothetical protein
MSEKINPLLAKVKMPGRVFALPSQGLLYKNNELFPTVVNGEVQVKNMSAIAEIKMRSADLLFSGRAIEEIILECISEIKNPFQLFSKDVDAILCFLRIATYGQFFEIELKHDCATAKQHTIAIDLEKIAAAALPLTPEIIEKYTVSLSNGQVVHMTPMRYSSLIDLLQIQKNAENVTASDIQEMFLKHMVEIIDDVDGISDKDMIREWVTAISPDLSEQIKNGYEIANAAWGMNVNAEVKCPDCGKTHIIEVPVDPVSFFSM